MLQTHYGLTGHTWELVVVKADPVQLRAQIMLLLPVAVERWGIWYVAYPIIMHPFIFSYQLKNGLQDLSQIKVEVKIVVRSLWEKKEQHKWV